MIAPPATVAGLSLLSVDDVVAIYDVITQDFAGSSDPISPAGVRDRGLLESAVHRQSTGWDGKLKYGHPLHNAASLVYGICCDHPFHNGNKRASLVALLVHLDRNDYALPGVSQSTLYEFMLQIAAHQVGVRAERRGKPKPRHSADDEVAAIFGWLRQHASKIERGERVLTYRQLRQALSHFGVHLEVTGANHAEIVRYVDKPAGFFRRRVDRQRVKIGGIGYRDDGTDVNKSEIKRIRQMCMLTEDDGVDSRAFYSMGITVDSFVCRYRRVLKRLARV